MTDRPSKAIGGGSIRLSLIAGLALLLVPVSGLAESTNLLITAENEPGIASLTVPVARQSPLRQDAADIVMVRYGDFSFSVGCGAGKPAGSLREQPGQQSPLKTVAGLSNLTVKVGFAF